MHGPPSHHTTGPLADRREDDVALLLLRRGDADGGRRPPAAPHGADDRRRTSRAQIADARERGADLLHDWAAADQVDSAVLLVSELITNVLVHTDGDAVLCVEVLGRPGARRLRVEVGDNSDDMPHLRRPGEMASSGRGLVLMEELADAWGVEPRGEGKSIWFELYEADPAR